MPFQVHQPETVADAVQSAREFGPDARFLAGGTDLIIQINRKRCAPRHLIALDRIAGLRGIEAGPNRIEIGAMTTHKAIEQWVAAPAHLVGGEEGSDHASRCEPSLHSLPQADGKFTNLAALAEAARVIGGHQVRNIATIGGNLANASPAADLLPVLLTLDAEVVLTGGNGARHLPLSRFLLGPGVTARDHDELLRQVNFPRPFANAATAFIKAGRRRAMEISVVCVAALLELDPPGICRTVRVGLGAVGPTALRAAAAEQCLQGRAPTEAALREAGRLAASACTPVSDVRASAEYRRLLVQALVPRALRRCVERIEAHGA